MKNKLNHLKNVFLGVIFLLVFSVGLTGFALANGGFINLSTYYTLPDKDVSVSGGNFPPNQNVQVSLGESSQNTTTDSAGKFASGNFKVPYSAVNSTVEAKAQGGSVQASANLGVGGFYPNVTPSSWYFTRGSKVSFTGMGFAPNEKVSVTANGENRGEVTANSSGNFSSPEYSLPYQGGPVTFTFTGQLSKAVSSRTITLASNQPHILLSTYYAPGGSKVMVTGHDFGSGEAVNINFEGLNLGSPVANSSGKFTHETTIPASSGKKNIQARGLTTNLSANAEFTIASF